MPQASEELRQYITGRFGSIDSEGPEQFLKSKGYVLHRGWFWTHPAIKSIQDMPEDEWLCLLFLVKEWDYDSLRG